MDKQKIIKLANRRHFGGHTYTTVSEELKPVFIGSAKKVRVIIDVHGTGDHNMQSMPQVLVGPWWDLFFARDNNANTSWGSASPAPTSYPDPTPIHNVNQTYEWVREEDQSSGTVLMPWMKIRTMLLPSTSMANAYITYSVTVVIDYD